MTLRLYNTLTRTKEDFVPLDPQNVRMYVCGPTVYDFAHIGNARPVIVFDVLFRLLRHLYGPEHVTYVRNITDVDDKINARALRDFPDLPLNEAIRNVTEKTANQFFADVKALGSLEPTVQPRATDNIPQMIDMIRTLIARGHAYQAAGEVLFSVGSMPDYGRLSQRNLDDQQAGARIAVEAHKKNPADFVLWKLSSPEEPGWDSPWGRGRPGWHIECSAMSNRYLGEVFDIHGGGLDLIFPHHENEIAQSRCAFGTHVMANTWMHNGFLQVEGQKMSKSLGNFVTIDHVLKSVPGAVARLVMLKTHYRAPIDWTLKSLALAESDLVSWLDELTPKKLSTLTRFTDPFALESWWDVDMPESIATLLCDDLNFSEVVKHLHSLRKEASMGNEESRIELWMALCSLGFIDKDTVLSLGGHVEWRMGEAPDNQLVAAVEKYRVFVCNGLLADALQIFNSYRTLGITIERGFLGQIEVHKTDGGAGLVESLIAARLEARKAKNWAESDRIRDELAAMGIAIKDNKDGTTSWEVKR